MKPRTVVFRTDASIDIGTGHVMRCLTLANELRERNVACLFVSREHPGHLLERIREQGFESIALPQRHESREPSPNEPLPAHADWLGTAWQSDATETVDALADRSVDWLVVDHYALDHRWESAVRGTCGRLMVIDDLADRRHDCDLLLDQNVGRVEDDYAALAPTDAQRLLGPGFALLRPEFGALRGAALERRGSGTIGQILITFGGVDRDNLTRRVLDTLGSLELPEACELLVVTGQDAPWLAEIRKFAASMPRPVKVQNEVPNIAQIMLESDLAIGAAGGTALEQCCLGLPSIFIVAAENQRRGAGKLAQLGAALVIDDARAIARELPRAFARMLDHGDRGEISRRCRSVTDGGGRKRVAAALMNVDEES